MTMVFGWGRSVPDRPCQKPSFSFNTRCVYAVCLAASILSVVILAYVTSFKHVQFVRNFFHDGKHSIPNGSGQDENTIQIVGLVNKNGDQIRLDSIMGYSPKGVLELRWMKNGSDPKSKIPETTARTPTNVTFEAKLNCTAVNTTSELLSMVPFRFLPNFKNPCWYEPLVKADVYKGNRYKSSRYSKAMFKELTEEWTKRLEELPEPKRLRCLPYFFIAGQPKCGSTDLYFKLTSHPDVVTPPMKEPHWWAKNRFGGWRSNLSVPVRFLQYVDLYDKAALFMEHVNDPNSSEEDEAYHQLITGDASVSTLWFNDYWWQLAENCGHKEPKYTNAHYIRYLLPHSKIIVILRNPTERLYSDYLYFQKQRKSATDFHKEVVIAINTLQKCLNTSTMRSCIYNRTIANYSRVRLRIGIYYVFIQEWLRLFPRQQLLIFRLEDYAQEPLDSLKNVFKFLGLRSLTSDEEEALFHQPVVANARKKKDRELGPMREDTRVLLDKFYSTYNQKLATLLHDTKYLWSSK